MHSYIEENHLPVNMLATSAFKKNEGKIFDGQFLDGISNAVDVISMIRYICMGGLQVLHLDDVAVNN